MRIQHNIMAMNAYRNYTNNVSAMKKNLEKLSSGYKINRAGDDAAGLAISEKMRAQITGLKQAQANAKSGINLVQTAEGALQEVHDMLNRMVKLADQSANGTYDEKTDRNQLQKEVVQLKEEIDRISKSANFNGIKLLNGDLDGATQAAVGKLEIIGGKVGANSSAVDGVQEADTITLNGGTITAGDKVTVKVQYLDKDNQLVSKDYTFLQASGKLNYAADGTEAGANLGAAIQAALEKDGANGTFNFSGASATNLVATAVNKGSASGQFLRMDVVVNGEPRSNAVSIARTAVGKDNMTGWTGFKAFNGADGEKAEEYVFTVNGAKFAFATVGNSGSFASDVNVVTLASGATANATDIKEMMMTINRVLGSDVARVSGTSLQFAMTGRTGAGGGLTLQIGDDSADYNQLKVSIQSCSTGAMGISGVDISTQTGAQGAVQTIKDAINYVSNIRGTLGATQNRLDHTINNLSVMEENIQDAESTIRDTDVADEMMAYTKNNILIQSAQAMLAQANQVPQGVLQLLQ